MSTGEEIQARIDAYAERMRREDAEHWARNAEGVARWKRDHRLDVRLRRAVAAFRSAW